MKFELIFLDYILILIGLFEIVGIACFAMGKRNRTLFISLLLVAAFNGAAIYYLLEMITGNHQSYLPYFLFIVSTLFLTFQWFRTKKNPLEG